MCLDCRTKIRVYWYSKSFYYLQKMSRNGIAQIVEEDKIEVDVGENNIVFFDHMKDCKKAHIFVQTIFFIQSYC